MFPPAGFLLANHLWLVWFHNPASAELYVTNLCLEPHLFLNTKLCQGLVRGQLSAPSQYKNQLKLPKIVNNFLPISLFYFLVILLVNQTKKVTEDFLHIFLQIVPINYDGQSYILQLYTVIFLWFLIIFTLNAPVASKVFCFSHLLKCSRSLYGNKCGPRSDCSYRSSLFWVHAVCFYT